MLILPSEPETILPLEPDPYVIEWSDRLFESAREFRTYMLRRGVDWPEFVRMHPAIVAQGRLVAVIWDGEEFYDQESLRKRLGEHGVSYRRWAGAHPDAATALSGEPIATPRLAAVSVREKRAVIRWSGISFTSANGLRMHLREHKVDWNAFLVRHPTASRRLGLVSVGWSGHRFYTRAALARWLASRGGSLETWQRVHSGFAEKLVP